MAIHQFSASAVIQAPAQDLYAILSDYRHGHPHILPRPPFVSLDVEDGGIGAGTLIHVRMRVFGRDQSFRAVVGEPEPGRVLVETNDNGFVTTFTVEPREQGRAASVSIASEMTVRDGPAGALEAWLTIPYLRRVYARELAQLAAFASKRAT